MTKEQVDKLAHYFAALYDRWQDEKQYENFADYRKAWRGRLAQHQATLRTFTQSPFKADVISVQGDLYTFKADATSVTVHTLFDGERA